MILVLFFAMLLQICQENRKWFPRNSTPADHDLRKPITPKYSRRKTVPGNLVQFCGSKQSWWQLLQSF